MQAISGISFFVPAYNAADTIVESIGSVVEAAKELDGIEVEIVVVDDGSTDGTAALVRTEYAGDARIRVHAHRRNRGGAAARNTAVEHAVHEWVFCLDSDNLVDPVSVQRMAEMAAAGDWDVVATTETRFFKTTPARSTHSWFWDRTSLDIGDVLSAYETPVAGGNYLFSTAAWARAGGYPEFAGSLDAWGFGVRLLFAGARFGVCPDTFYLHRQGHESYYIRDSDDRRAIAAAQILLPYVSRLSVRDRKRLLGDGELLDYFAQIPSQPLTVEGLEPQGSAARVVVDGGAVAAPRPIAETRVRRLRRAIALRRHAQHR